MGEGFKNKNKMKRTYIKPESALIDLTDEPILIGESMDVKDGDIDDPIEVQSKQVGFIFEDDDAD